MVGEIFRCLIPAVGDEETRVMMPLLASGAQVCLCYFTSTTLFIYCTIGMLLLIL
jgi:hypothetical protein